MKIKTVCLPAESGVPAQTLIQWDDRHVTQLTIEQTQQFILSLQAALESLDGK